MGDCWIEHLWDICPYATDVRGELKACNSIPCLFTIERKLDRLINLVDPPLARQARIIKEIVDKEEV